MAVFLPDPLTSANIKFAESNVNCMTSQHTVKAFMLQKGFASVFGSLLFDFKKAPMPIFKAKLILPQRLIGFWLHSLSMKYRTQLVAEPIILHFFSAGARPKIDTFDSGSRTHATLLTHRSFQQFYWRTKVFLIQLPGRQSQWPFLEAFPSKN